MQLKKRKQGGMGLVEIIIGLAIMGAVLGYLVRMNARAESQTMGRARADALASFQQLAGQFFLGNRAGIESAMGGDSALASDLCRINVAADGTGGTTTMNSTKRTCAFDSTLLKAKGGWPSGQMLNVSSNTRYVAIARQIMSNDAVPEPTGDVEMLVVMAQLDATGNVMTSGTVTFTGDKEKAMQEIKAGMDALGGTGGYIPPGSDTGPCRYNATVKQACGNGWSVSLNDFL